MKLEGRAPRHNSSDLFSGIERMLAGLFFIFYALVVTFIAFDKNYWPPKKAEAYSVRLQNLRNGSSMTLDMSNKMMQIFLELHSGIPREGPGDSSSTAKAFSMITGLPEKPLILDVGCGPGMQTLDLAKLSDGTITAVDYYRQYLDVLQKSAAAAGLANRITTFEADMAALDFEPATFDLIWSEGAAYIMGFDNALRSWKPLLKPTGWLAVTEAAWTRPDPPSDLREFWESEYPAIKDVEANLALIREAGYEIAGHFKLPDASWWDHYYTPLHEKIEVLRAKYGNNPDIAALIESQEQEADCHRRYANYYGYVFFVMRAG